MIGTTLNLVSKYREQKFCFNKNTEIIVIKCGHTQTKLII